MHNVSRAFRSRRLFKAHVEDCVHSDPVDSVCGDGTAVTLSEDGPFTCALLRAAAGKQLQTWPPMSLMPSSPVTFQCPGQRQVPPGLLGAHEKEPHCDLSCKEMAIKSLPAPKGTPVNQDPRVPPALEMSKGRAGEDPPHLTPREWVCSSHVAVKARARTIHTPAACSLHPPRPERLCLRHTRTRPQSGTIPPTSTPQDHIQMVPAARV